MRISRLAAFLGACTAAAAFAPALADPPSQAAALAAARQAGAKLFAQRCAACHEAPGSKAPTLDQLGRLTPQDVGKALVIGKMAGQAQGLDMNAIKALAVFVSHTAPRPDPDAAANRCGTLPPANAAAGGWNGWGETPENTRFTAASGLTPDSVPHLRVKWAFSYTGAMVYGQPSVAGGRVYVTSETGRVQALDARTGCTIWSFEAGSPTRTAISVGEAGGRMLAYFGDETATLHALDAQTGHEIWRRRLDQHPKALITGAPALYQGRLYAGVASGEEQGASPPYACCSFRGSLAAIDAATGNILWQSYTIPETPAVYRTMADGTKLMGPAGAAIWSSPTIDTKLQRIYVGTGNSYTGVRTPYSDAIMAFDMASGKRIWSNQVTPADNFVIGCFAAKPPVCMSGVCNGPGEGECPDTVGPDHDFGASPVLISLPGGRRVLVAGQKSAWVYGMDPDAAGKLLWKRKVGIGGPAGGIEWGMAADGRAVYAATSDMYVAPPDKAGGLTALDPATGRVLWHAAPHPVCAWGGADCLGSQSQAVTAMPGLVFSGGLDGHLRAFSARNGHVVWDADLGGSFATVNQGMQQGGSLNHGGAVLADGMLFVNAGYGRFAGRNGHVLLALAP